MQHASHHINSIDELEQRSPSWDVSPCLQYMLPCKKPAHAQSWGVKLMHEQVFCMGTCLEEDSAPPLAWRGFVQIPRACVAMHLFLFVSLRTTSPLSLRLPFHKLHSHPFLSRFPCPLTITYSRGDRDADIFCDDERRRPDDDATNAKSQQPDRRAD